jgi:hypothetical protein
MALSTSSANDGHIGMRVKKPYRLTDPSVNYLTVTVDEKDIPDIRVSLQEPFESSVPGSRRRKRLTHIQLQDLCSQRGSHRD